VGLARLERASRGGRGCVGLGVLERSDIRRLVEEKDFVLFSSRRVPTFKWCSVSLRSPMGVESVMFAILATTGTQSEKQGETSQYHKYYY
jgi:hypothetical protein